jgi:hypothetical protein
MAHWARPTVEPHAAQSPAGASSLAVPQSLGTVSCGAAFLFVPTTGHHCWRTAIAQPQKGQERWELPLFGEATERLPLTILADILAAYLIAQIPEMSNWSMQKNCHLPLATAGKSVTLAPPVSEQGNARAEGSRPDRKTSARAEGLIVPLTLKTYSLQYGERPDPMLKPTEAPNVSRGASKRVKSSCVATPTQ